MTTKDIINIGQQVKALLDTIDNSDTSELPAFLLDGNMEPTRAGEQWDEEIGDLYDTLMRVDGYVQQFTVNGQLQ